MNQDDPESRIRDGFSRGDSIEILEHAFVTKYRAIIHSIPESDRTVACSRLYESIQPGREPRRYDPAIPPHILNYFNSLPRSAVDEWTRPLGRNSEMTAEDMNAAWIEAIYDLRWFKYYFMSGNDPRFVEST